MAVFIAPQNSSPMITTTQLGLVGSRGNAFDIMSSLHEGDIALLFVDRHSVLLHFVSGGSHSQ